MHQKLIKLQIGLTLLTYVHGNPCRKFSNSFLTYSLLLSGRIRSWYGWKALNKGDFSSVFRGSEGYHAQDARQTCPRKFWCRTWHHLGLYMSHHLEKLMMKLLFQTKGLSFRQIHPFWISLIEDIGKKSPQDARGSRADDICPSH